MGEKTVTSETTAKPAGIIDTITGNATKDGAKTENGEVVTETKTTEVEDSDD